MIRKFISGNEHFICSNCGEETRKHEYLCQVCGHEFYGIKNQAELESLAKSDETICIVIGAHNTGVFTFTQLKIDSTPRMLLNLPSFQNQRLMREADPYEFYAFKTHKYPYLREGKQLNLCFDNYENFKTFNGFKIFYDKTHFTNDDIRELKTYNFKL
jgi:hypothetical protein